MQCRAEWQVNRHRDLVRLDLVQWLERAGADIVHQDRHRSEVALDVGNHGRDRFRVSHVAGIGTSGRPDPRRHVLQRTAPACYQRDTCALTCEFLGDRRTDSHRRPGDDRDLPLECAHHEFRRRSRR